jgi:hypothetical protein
MAAAIIINQAAKPPGVSGVAREDLDLGTDILLTADGGPFLSYLWSIVDRPIDIVAPAESTSVLATPTTITSLVTPVDVAGSYLVELLVDSGQGLGATAADVARITFYAGPSLNADPTAFPRREPAFRETGEHNVADVIFPSGNPKGWAQEMRRWFALVRELKAKVDATTRVTIEGTVTTVDATPTTIATLSLPDQHLGIGHAEMVALNSSIPEASLQSIYFYPGRLLGSATGIGTQTIIYDLQNFGPANLAIDTSGPDVLVQVVGNAAVIKWRVIVSYFIEPV